jgi:hypothetical protein
MAHDHRMNPVGSNHRPTPRVAQAVAKRLGYDTQVSTWDTAPHLYRTTQGPSVDEVQAGLDNYRYNRDHGSTPDTVAKTAKYIGEAIKMEKSGSPYAPDRPYTSGRPNGFYQHLDS